MRSCSDLVRLSALAGCLAAAPLATGAAGDIEGHVALTRLAVGSGMSGPEDVVVYLEGVADAAAAPVRVGIGQRGKRFWPSMLVVPVGSTVEFPNDDDVFHNVFSLTPGNAFDFGLYPRGARRSMTFRRPGLVAIYCNIHPQMMAHVLVVENPFHGRPGRDGRFQLTGVPAGSHVLVAWSPRTAPLRQEIHVRRGETARLDLQVVERGGAERHRRKDGTPYASY